MNILVVSQYYTPEPFRIHEICQELVRRGHQVTVLTGLPNYPEGELYPGYADEDQESTLDGVRVIRCRICPRRRGNRNLARNYISFVSSVSRFIRKKTLNYEKFDVIYAYQLSPVTSVMPALTLRKKYGTPVFLYCLDLWPESLRETPLEKQPFFSALTVLSRKIYRSADKIAVTSPSFSKYLSDLCGMAEEEISFLPQHSILVDIPEGLEPSLAEYDRFVNFVFMGNVGEAQNVECILSAASRLPQDSSIRIHIVGSGSHLERCMEMAKELGVEPLVVFHGRQPREELPRFYAIADVCLVTLRDEGIVGKTIPGKLQEYLSAGKPILGCLNGDAAHVIQAAVCGCCVPAGDADGLARAMEDMAGTPEALSAYGAQARAYFDLHFRLDRHVDALERMLGELKK